jgi:putative MATE family efflux protein
MTSSEFLAAIKESLHGGHRDYTDGPIGRAIALLAIPMVLEMVMESLFAVVDIFWVAHLGANAVATVGLTESMESIVFGAALGLSAGATALVARRIGEKDPAAAGSAAGQSLLLGILFSILIGIPAGLGARNLLALLSGDEALAAYGHGYTRAMLYGTPSIILLFLVNAVFRGAGDAVFAMRALWLANGLNMILDPFLIFGWGPFPEMGVAGAGVATVIGRSVGVLYGLFHLFSGRREVRLTLAHLKPDFDLIDKVLRLSLPAAGQHLIATASWLGLARIVASFGSAAMAGYTIAIRIVVFTILPAWGLSNAAATLVGQNLGAKKPERAERSVHLCGLANTVFLVGLSAVFLLWPEFLVRLFTDDPAVVPFGVSCLRILSYGYAVYAWGMVLMNAFNGAGDTTTPTVINFFCFWCWQLPLAWALSRPYGPTGVFAAVPIAEATIAVTAWVLFRRGKWKLREV